ncbi:hypothetical protein DPMN_119083 [Dreissena polymorpha]|uniref:Uncharacterized protein n=1 Tax=Dreissena polymorpha TaxID=45954 RepID=A0A9D4GLU5_DREPO|nr:hypothetical protein DPMN_119083 [Dreissena polymorpha]
MEAVGVEIMCLVGFMRILSGKRSTLLTVVTSPIYGGSWCGNWCLGGFMRIPSGKGSTLLTVVTSPIYVGSGCGDCVSDRLHEDTVR